jgi:predicted transglutaminase-like cysteine proteinase
MKIIKSLPLLLLAALSLCACATTGSEAPSQVAAMPSVMPTGMVVQAPRGYAVMCLRTPDLCDLSPETADAAKATLMAAASSGESTGAILSNAEIAALEAGDKAAPIQTHEAPAIVVDEAPAPVALADATQAAAETVPVAPVEVVADPAAPKLALLSDPPRALLDTINRRVNAKVRQQSDQATYHAEEVWNRPVVSGGLLSGDCEDLAIEKRQELIAAGVDPKSLTYAVVYRGDIGLHVLLVASTSEGDLALDSRTPWIEPWSKVPYIWVKRQVAADPTQWVMVLPVIRTAAARNAASAD